MGVSFTWEVVGPVEEHSFAYGSNLNNALENCFGSFPIELDDSNIKELRGIMSCGHGDIEELINAICEHGKVRIKAHW